MPRIQPLTCLLRPLAAPRTVTGRQHFRFSTATRLCVEKPSRPAKPTAPSQAPPAAPTTPQEAARAADLAAAEAITESDSAQPPEPKPDLPSERARSPTTTNKADDVVPPAAPTTHPNTQSALEKAPAQTPSTTASTTSTRADAVPRPPQTTSKPNTESGLKNNAAPARLKYHVGRSANHNLPIYTDRKRGGNLHQTMIRKITGDAMALRDDLRVYLNKTDEDVKVNPLTQHVIIKGFCTEKVKTFLEERGF